jgi:hypothetical protein
MMSAVPRLAWPMARAVRARLAQVARRWPPARVQARAACAREQGQAQAVFAREERQQTRAPPARESPARTPAPERWRRPMGRLRASEPEPAQRPGGGAAAADAGAAAPPRRFATTAATIWRPIPLTSAALYFFLKCKATGLYFMPRSKSSPEGCPAAMSF